MATYYEKNAETIKQKQRDYYQKNKEHIKQVQKAYRDGNAQLKANKKAFYEANREDILEKRSIKTKERCVCVCGCDVVRVQLKRHMETKKHHKALEQIKIMSDKIDGLMKVSNEKE